MFTHALDAQGWRASGSVRSHSVCLSVSSGKAWKFEPNNQCSLMSLVPFYPFLQAGEHPSPPVFTCFHLCDSNPKQSSHSSDTGHYMLTCRALQPRDGPRLRCPLLLGMVSQRNWRNESVIRKFLQPNFVAQRQNISFLSRFVFHLTLNLFKTFCKTCRPISC